MNTRENIRFDIAAIDHYKEFFIMNKLEKRILRYADMLCAGQLTFGYDTLPVIQYDSNDLSNFSWTFNGFKLTNTFFLYAFGLLNVYILSKAFIKTNNLKYYDLAWKFIKSFYNHVFSNQEKNEFIYNDHAVAERNENLIFFGYAVEKSGKQIEDMSIIKNLILDCNNRLVNDKYYQYKHNHGIIVDKSLIIGGYCINNNDSHKLINHAILRLKDQIKFGFGLDGVHVENSIDYHFSITNLLRGVQNCLIHINHPFSQILQEILDKSIEYIVYSVKPNRQRPLFGDSKGVKGLRPSDLDELNDPYLQYIKSFGNKGKKPQKINAKFLQSGYIFFREHFNETNYSQSTWLSLKCGYKTRTHKHQDDLSICLYSKGYDIFIDPGMYNFMPKNIFKEYLESIPAHSTIGILNTPYSIAKANGEKLLIQEVKHHDDYEYVLASSKVYKDCSIYRHLFYFRMENIIIIRDEIFSKQPHTIAQYFHLGPMVKILQLEMNRSVLQIGDSGYSLVMKQLNSVDHVKKFEGTKTNPMSIMSSGFSNYIDSQSIGFLKHAQHFEFITTIEIKPSSNATSEYLDQVFLDKNRLKVNQKEIILIPTKPVEVLNISVFCEKNKIIIKNFEKELSDRQFALYIYEENSRQKIDEVKYSSEQFIEYCFSKPGKYVLIYYISNSRREKIKGILAELEQNTSTLFINKKYETLHNPEVGSITVIEENKKKVKLEIPIHYDFPFQVKWWVYRNGISLLTVNFNNSNSFTFHFPSSGDYVIMCSVSDVYFGEFYFCQHDIIHIE